MINSLLAEIQNPSIKSSVGSGLGGDKDVTVLAVYITNFVKIMFIVGTISLFFMLLLGAFEYVTAGGEKDKVGNSTKRMSNAIIGIILMLSAYAIFRLINTVFGINILNLEVPVI